MKQDWHPDELDLHWTLSESELRVLATSNRKPPLRHQEKPGAESATAGDLGPCFCQMA
jgi:hypothetical protein